MLEDIFGGRAIFNLKGLKSQGGGGGGGKLPG